MIIAKTKLKKMPTKCEKCKFCEDVDVANKATKENGYIAVTYWKKKCNLTGAIVPYVYDKSSNSWNYIKCKSCPLVEVNE